MGTRTPSLPLFKEETQQLNKGKRLGQKTLSLPLFNVDGKSMLTGIRGDASGPTGRALLNKKVPSQTGHGLGMAHHYRTSGTRNKAHPHTGDSPLPQEGPGRTQQRNLHQGEPNRPPGSIGQPRRMPNVRPPKDKHLCLLTLRVNFTTEPLTPATAGARTSLGGCQECPLI